jgi:hypothetical protein
MVRAGLAGIVCILLLSCMVSNTEASSWSWNLSDAYEYLYYAYAAYCDPNTITNWSCKWCQEADVSDFVVTAQPYDAFISGYGFIGYHQQNQTSTFLVLL